MICINYHNVFYNFVCSQAIINKREYCARATQICSPQQDDLSDNPNFPDV